MSVEFSANVIKKAQRFVRDGRVTPDLSHPEDGEPHRFTVRGDSSTYVVNTDASHAEQRATWISCTCPHGRNVSSRIAHCAHAVAVLMVVRDGLR